MRGMASFIAGFGNGYFKAQDKKYERERQEKQDAWQEEQQGRQRKEWDRADRLESDLQAAGTPIAVEQPNDVLKDDDGNDMPAVPPLRVGTQRYATMEEATKAAADANTPEAQNKRMVQAYRNAGQFDKAVTMENQLRQGEAADMQLANLKFQEKLGNWMGGGFDGFRDGINAYESGPFKGKKIDFITSPDGKTRTIGIVGADGEVAPTALTVPNTQEGLIQLGFLLDKTVKPADRLTMYRQERKDELDAQKVAIQERLAAAREKQVDAMSFRLMSGGGGGGGRAAASGDTPQGLPDPMANFDSKKAYATAAELAAKESELADKPATPQQIAARTTEIYRSLESEFLTSGLKNLALQSFERSALKIKTPQELSALYQRGLAGGLTPDDMVAIDPRFAEVARAAKPAAGGNQGAAPADGVRQGAEGSPATPKVLATMGGGLSKKAEPYTPPADSPAGKAQASREAARTASMKQEAQRIKAVTDAASAAIASGDPAAAQAVQSMPGFGTLPLEQKAQIRRIVFGR